MNKEKMIPQPIWDELETFMGDKLSNDSDLYEKQLHEIIIEFMGCITNKKLFVDIAKTALESIEIIVEENL